ncbi:hypothetical protein U1Q18_015634 [Sarracenia purpurea var. burkii]
MAQNHTYESDKDDGIKDSRSLNVRIRQQPLVEKNPSLESSAHSFDGVNHGSEDGVDDETMETGASIESHKFQQLKIGENQQRKGIGNKLGMEEFTKSPSIRHESIQLEVKKINP